MKNDLNSLIAHYQEKFESFWYNDIRGEQEPMQIELFEKLLRETLKEAITQAFLATKVERKEAFGGRSDFAGQLGCQWCGAREAAYHINPCKVLEAELKNAALTEVEELQKAFVQGK